MAGLDQLIECSATQLKFDVDDPDVTPQGIMHELAHVYTLTNSMFDADNPAGPIARAWVYIATEVYDPAHTSYLVCPAELLADLMEEIVLVGLPDSGEGGQGRSTFRFLWNQCADRSLAIAAGGPFSAEVSAIFTEINSVLTAAMAGDSPTWTDSPFADGQSLWTAISTPSVIEDLTPRVVMALLGMLKGEFGGYCDESALIKAALGGDTLTNPWQDSGCDPPKLDQAVLSDDGTSIRLVFSEPLDTTQTLAAADFTVTASGGTSAVAAAVAYHGSESNVIVVTPASTLDTAAGASVAYDSTGDSTIADTYGQVTDSFTTGQSATPPLTR